MSAHKPICEVHISGVALSYLLNAAYNCQPSTKYVFNLYGHHEVRTVVTDSSESVEKVEAVIVGAAPASSSVPVSKEMYHIGFLSISKSPVHKLSWNDSVLLSPQTSENGSLGSSSYPTLLLLMTSDQSPQGAATLKVDYTVFISASSESSSLEVVPLIVDNIVDSLSGFTKLSDICRRNSSILYTKSSKEAAQNDLMNKALDDALLQVGNQSEEKARLVKRIIEIQTLLSEKK